MAFPKIDGYVVTEKLGSGSYSIVYKAYTKVGARSVVAIKCVDKSRIKHSGSAVDNLITEIRLLKNLRHPHIVEMKDFTWDDKNIYIITEYCCGGDLSKYIRRYGRVPERQVRFFLQQLASALKFLREKDVCHMDLKPHNLLLHRSPEGRYTLKVADFGFAQHMSSDATECNIRGSPLYMAPEMFTGGTYDARVDLWSVGVITYECLFGRAPYSSNTFKELMEKIKSQAPIQIPSNASISPECRQLLTSLLQHDPRQRISYDDFFSCEYLDLEHMPGDHNYEKAISLIKQAIEADSNARSEAALDLYCKALRYLVPRVQAEHDSLKKAALSDKVHMYMRRAEELKAALRGLNPAVDCNPQLPASSHCNSYAPNISNDERIQQLIAQNGVAESHAQESNPAPDDVKSPIVKSEPRAGMMRRLFRRGEGRDRRCNSPNSVDSDVQEEAGTSEKKDKMVFGETADFCKIN